MSNDRDELVSTLHRTRALTAAAAFGVPPEASDEFVGAVADAILASDWLAEHDRAVQEAERESIANAIEAHAENEAERTKWDGMAGLLGNWVNGIREGARFLRGELPSDLDAAIRTRITDTGAQQ